MKKRLILYSIPCLLFFSQLAFAQSANGRVSHPDIPQVTRQVEQVNPGDPSSGLHVAEQAIATMRTGSNGVATEQKTVSVVGQDGLTHVVLVDMGKTDKPAAVQVDMSKKPAAK